METIAQTALKTFEDNWLTLNYTNLSAADKLTHVLNHYDLKIKAVKEIESNRIESESANTTAQTERTKSITDSLTALGYECDNSLADWQKLYNHPKRYGANWQAQANYQVSISTGVDYFLNHAYGLIYNNYQLNFWYDAGDTFTLSGVLYEVIQSHKTQSDWIPATTPALYKKCVPVGTIAHWVQPTGAHDAYVVGVTVTYGGFTWLNTTPANVWQPGVYGWTKQ